MFCKRAKSSIAIMPFAMKRLLFDTCICSLHTFRTVICTIWVLVAGGSSMLICHRIVYISHTARQASECMHGLAMQMHIQDYSCSPWLFSAARYIGMGSRMQAASGPFQDLAIGSFRPASTNCNQAECPAIPLATNSIHYISAFPIPTRLTGFGLHTACPFAI